MKILWYSNDICEFLSEIEIIWVKIPVNWKSLAGQSGIVEVKQLVATFKASVEAAPKPVPIEIKVYELPRGTFHAEPSHLPVLGPSKPSFGGTGRLQAARLNPPKPGTKPLEPAPVLAFRQDHRSPEDALRELLRQLSQVARRNPAPSWVPNPEY